MLALNLILSFSFFLLFPKNYQSVYIYMCVVQAGLELTVYVPQASFELAVSLAS